MKIVLFYGSETWRTIKAITRKIQTYLNNCLQRLLRIVVCWSETINNEEFWIRTGQAKIEEEIKIRKWRWLEHNLRKTDDNIIRQALKWKSQGKQKRSWPRNNWRRDLGTKEKKKGESLRGWLKTKIFAAQWSVSYWNFTSNDLAQWSVAYTLQQV